MTGNNGTYFERLKGRLLDNRVIAWSVVVFGVGAAVASVVPQVREMLGLLPRGEDPPALHLRVLTYDPRFSAGAERLNWGGGSQSLFVDDGRPLPGRIGAGSGADDLDGRLEGAGAATVWEVVPPGDADGLVMLVDVAYDRGARNDLVITAWGIRAQPVAPPTSGFFVHYRTGGAYVGREGGVVQIPGPGAYPVRRWVTLEGDEEVDRGFSAETLEPGEVKAFAFNVVGPEENPAAWRQDAGPPNLDVPAVLLTAYARVWVEGREWEVESSNGIRALIPADARYSDYRTDRSDAVEDLRPRTVRDR